MLRTFQETTWRKGIDQCLKNFEENLPYVERTVRDLRWEVAAPSSALVVGMGPSLHRRGTAERLRRTPYDGVLVSSDGAFSYLIRRGVVPQYVISVDYLDWVVRWFGDPELEKRGPDGYFKNLDIDPQFIKDDAERQNQELIRLVNEVGPRVKAILPTTIPPAIARRCREAGMAVYWWNPILDEQDRPESLTRTLYRRVKAPCMASGGNCGAAGYVFAATVLGAKRVGLAGIDMGYYPDTPLEKTQFYLEMKARTPELTPEEYKELIIRVTNPHDRTTYYTDPPYYCYREVLLNLIDQAGVETHNCAGGGTVFSDRIRWTSLEDFLQGGSKWIS